VVNSANSRVSQSACISEGFNVIKKSYQAWIWVYV